ncbi:MAG: SDR family NAD(P)-dependent oxidoreductase [Gammaproteobacteria bacterium]|jgi:NAD(P)-dependent dehydrogenase (short-subunit alcohol dehydrogenase family)|nr:SDR family NAD(P)-dependent oxidoreductase [Gammaproteobacteria bacterium]MBT7886363.1 SDR family NAD(P)-dependent oxidoreductase [Gammaproteobacteria bacterium]
MTRQTIFITGAASGIGRATALQFHARGWFVGAADVDLAGLESLKADLHDDCFTAFLDVTDKPAFDQVMIDFGAIAGHRLDILFNNAGIAVFGFLDEVPFEKTLATVNVNLIGVLNGIHASIHLLKQTPNALCFTTSSSAACFGTPGMATYGATKVAVKGLTEAMSVELARFGARAADVSPGIIDTPLWQTGSRFVRGESRPVPNIPSLNHKREDAGRTLPADAVAECVWDAYIGEKLHWYVPPEVVERDKEKALNPEKLRDELIAQQKK